MERDECIMCRFWTGRTEDPAGECRRLAPVQATGFQRPWPTTSASDWCHLFAPRGGVPGGRGNRLTNAEIVDHVDQEGGVAREILQEKMQTSGLPGPIAERRVDRMIELGLLVEESGMLRVGDGKPLKKPKPTSEEAPEPDDQPETPEPREKKAAAPRPRRHSLDVYLPRLRQMATPDSPAGFNQMFQECNEIVAAIGKGTFSQLIGEALRDGKIFKYQSGQFAGRYYFESEIDPP